MNDPNPKAQRIGHWDFLLVLIAALLPTYLIRFSVFSIPTTLLEAAIWTVVLLGVLQPSVRRSWVSAARALPKPILFLSLLFLVSAVISTIVSPHLETSLGILKGWIITPMVYGFLVYAASLENRSLKLEIGKALILSGLVMALVGLSQVGQLERIKSLYDVPNSLALFLAPLIVLASFQIPASRFQLLAAGVMFIALLFTQSLAGVLSALTVLGMYLCFRYWKLKPVWFLCFVICAFIAVLVLTPKINYLLQPTSSAQVRLQLWSVSWDLIKENPVLGIGLGTFEPAYQEKLHERFSRPASAGQPAPLAEFVFRDPHNWVLSFWLNLGLLGLLSFSFLHAFVFFWAFKHWDLIDHWKLVIGILGALLTLLVVGLVDTIYWKNDLATLHWLLLFLLLIFPETALLSPQRTEY